MSERKAAHLRLALTVLLVLNVAAFVYIVLARDSGPGAAQRIRSLQINADRIQLLGAANRGPGQAGAPGKTEQGVRYGACLEWGPFDPTHTREVESALAQLKLPDAPTRRALNDAAGANRYSYVFREPDSALVARIAELRQAFPGSTIRAAPCPG